MAALAVVYLHDSVVYLHLYGRLDPLPWHLANAVQMTSHFAVPMFLMISGALLLGRPTGEVGPYLRRRLGTVLKPYAFGATLHFLYDGWQGAWPASAHALAAKVLSGNAAYHLYFLWVLAGIYLLTPLLAGAARLPCRTLVTVTALLFAVAMAERHLNAFGLSLGYLSLGAGLSYLPYFLAGYALATHGPPPLRACLALFALGAAAGTALTWAGFASGRFDQSTVSDPLSVVTVPMSLAAFGALLHLRIESPRARRAITALAGLTLGIYVLHLVVARELATALSRLAEIPPLWLILLLPPATFATAALLTALLRRIPGVRGFV